MFRKGDRVKWKFRYGETSGIITKVHHSDFVFMNRQRKASTENPLYEVMSEHTEKKSRSPLIIAQKYVAWFCAKEIHSN